MQEQELSQIIRSEVLMAAAVKGSYFVPAAVSNRHIHLSQKDRSLLFGETYQLKPLRPLLQPGQYACQETVSLVGPKGRIDNIRVLGPERKETQIELSVTDCYKLGIPPVIRNSGDLNDTPGGLILGSSGQVTIQRGVIVSARHLHISSRQAMAYGLKDGQIINVKSSGVRGVILQNVLVRVGDAHELELHLDTDEANAALIHNGDLLEIIARGY